MGTFYLRYDDIRAALVALISGAEDDVTTFFEAYEGSVVVGGQQSNPSNDPNLQSNMQNAFSNGGSIAGLSILESSFTGS